MVGSLSQRLCTPSLTGCLGRGCLVQLGQLYTQMSTIVAEQEEVVNRIDADIDVARNYIEAGQVG